MSLVDDPTPFHANHNQHVRNEKRDNVSFCAEAELYLSIHISQLNQMANTLFESMIKDASVPLNKFQPGSQSLRPFQKSDAAFDDAFSHGYPFPLIALGIIQGK